MKTFIIALSVSVALIIGSSTAIAQYPQPTGSLTLAAATVNSNVGANVPLTCTIRNAGGSPIAGAPCTFAIESEPGNDAEVGSKVVTRTTDSAGVAMATLKTGSTPGQIVVSATSGSLRSVTVISVGNSGSPPAAGVIPPSTGDGGLVK